MSLSHRRNILVSNFGGAQAPSTVTVYPVGAECSGASTDTTVPVHAGHSFRVDDKLLLNPGAANDYRLVTAVTATQLTVNSNLTFVSGDRLLNLGPDTGVSSPAYDSSPVKIYSAPDGTSALSNAEVSPNNGEYEYFHKGDGRMWELVRNTLGQPIGVITGYAGVGGRISTADYGCAVDGATDDAAALQAAVLAAQANGQTLFLSSGTSVVSSRVDITENLTVEGSGWESVLRCGSTNVVLFADQAGSPIEINLSNFTVDGDSKGELDAGLIQFNDKVSYRLERLQIMNGGDATNAPQGVNGFGNGGTDQESIGIVRDCLFTGHDKPAIYINTGGNHVSVVNNVVHSITGEVSQGIVAAGAKRVIIGGNQIYDVGGVAISVDASVGRSPEQIIVRDNIVRDCGNNNSAGTTDGIAIERGSSDPNIGEMVISGNIVTNCGTATTGGSGIRTAQFSQLIVAQNICRANGFHGILIDSENDAASGLRLDILGNQCSNNNQKNVSNGSGIHVREIDGAQIANNRCWDDQSSKTQDYGIFFSDTASSNCLVVDNVLYGHGVGAISWGTFPSGSLFAGNIENAGDQYFGVWGNSDPTVRIGEGKDAQAYLDLSHVASTTSRVRNLSDSTGDSNLELDAVVRDGSGDASIDLHKNAGTSGVIRTGLAGQSSSVWNHYAFSETINLTGATNDGSPAGLPADSIVETVLVRVLTAPNAGTSLSVGDQSPDASRFASGVSVAAGTTKVCLDHVNSDTANPTQTGVRITVSGGTPTSGQVRVVAFYRRFTPPQS